MNKTIDELNALTSADNGDELIIFDVSENTSKKITKSNILQEVAPVDAVTSGNTHPATSNAVYNAVSAITPVDSVTDGETKPPTSNAVYNALANNTVVVPYNLITASTKIKSVLNTQTYSFQFFITKTGQNSYHLRLNSIVIECKDSGQEGAYISLFDYSNALSQLFGETRAIRSAYGSMGIFINNTDGTSSVCSIYTGGGDGKQIVLQLCINHNNTAYPKDGITFNLVGDIDICM